MDRAKKGTSSREVPTLPAAASTSNDVWEVIRLRNLAVWYREFADKAAVPWIWEARLHHAEALDREADLITARGGVRPATTIQGVRDTVPLASHLKER